MKPTAVLLCGLPYSGKTALATSLALEGYVIISLNEINRARGLGLHGNSVPGGEWLETHRIANERMREFLAQGRNVVWDDTNYAAWIRDPVFDAALDAGAEPVWVWVDTPIDEIRRRADGRYPTEDLEKLIRDFEKPCCAIRLDGKQPIDVALQPLRRAMGKGVLG
ncbi:ATP-binding protein [Fimbriimonas ginsengisoli]|uniref:Phosphoryl Seryl-TRNA(Ser/Sec) Kinase n=1 Tax=Fimbriimonas ginsengisoli Gsoil 348 TaxID=661478 RepID=A0A068NKE6_FIMGI|nr:ATP-binding protein [Fimbriimonas ginsengisoli]AIE83917.1 Phosphoryl Seryl-TRNA(Ser/Sec) Kinase [Fimbriimonas ginsengisoli Gsoil 348]